MRRDRYQKGVAIVDSYDKDSEDERVEIGIVEWTKNRKTVSCP